MHRGQASLATLLVLSLVVCAPFKRCSCRRAFTRAEWYALPSAGEIVDDVERLRLANCPSCGSTLATVEERFASNDVADRVPPTLRSLVR